MEFAQRCLTSVLPDTHMRFEEEHRMMTPDTRRSTATTPIAEGSAR